MHLRQTTATNNSGVCRFGCPCGNSDCSASVFARGSSDAFVHCISVDTSVFATEHVLSIHTPFAAVSTGRPKQNRFRAAE